MKDNSNDGRPRRRVPDETYLGDVAAAEKVAQRRRDANRGKPIDPAPVAAANLRQQVVSFLGNDELAELLAFVSSAKGPYKIKCMAWNLEARRKSLLKQLRRNQ